MSTSWAHDLVAKQSASRAVFDTEIGDVLISTSSLPSSYAPDTHVSVIFVGPTLKSERYYRSLAEAEVGHAEWVDEIRRGV